MVKSTCWTSRADDVASTHTAAAKHLELRRKDWMLFTLVATVTEECKAGGKLLGQTENALDHVPMMAALIDDSRERRRPGTRLE